MNLITMILLPIVWVVMIASANADFLGSSVITVDSHYPFEFVQKVDLVEKRETECANRTSKTTHLERPEWVWIKMTSDGSSLDEQTGRVCTLIVRAVRGPAAPAAPAIRGPAAPGPAGCTPTTITRCIQWSGKQSTLFDCETQSSKRDVTDFIPPSAPGSMGPCGPPRPDQAPDYKSTNPTGTIRTVSQMNRRANRYSRSTC